jgi:hypothetical protein
MTDSTECTRLRISLGVYVLGAIEPAERAMVDTHLSHCGRCRDELASLAGLPALLGRVTEDQIAELGPPSGELLDSILAQAARESRTRWRRNGVWLAAAAAVLVAVTGAGVDALTRGNDGGRPVPSITSPARPPSGTEPAAAKTVTGHDPVTGVRAQIIMQSKEWGTAFTVHLTGAPPGARCRLYAIDKNGRSDVAGGWEVEYEGYADFGGSSMIQRNQIAAVEIRTTAGQRLLKVAT